MSQNSVIGHIKLKRLFAVSDYFHSAKTTGLSRLPVHDDELNVNVLTILVQEIGHKVGYGLIRDVTAQYDVSTSQQAMNQMGHDFLVGSHWVMGH